MKLIFCQNFPLTGQSFWQNNSFITHILFELHMSILIFSPVQIIIIHPLRTIAGAVCSKNSSKFPIEFCRSSFEFLITFLKNSNRGQSNGFQESLRIIHSDWQIRFYVSPLQFCHTTRRQRNL